MKQAFTIASFMALFVGCQSNKLEGLALYTVEEVEVLAGSLWAFMDGSYLPTPLLSEEELVAFNPESLTFTLSPSGAKVLDESQSPMEPTAVRLTLDGKPLLGFWLWGQVSSLGCDWLVAYPGHGVVALRKGLPSASFADSLYSDEWVLQVQKHWSSRRD